MSESKSTPPAATVTVVASHDHNGPGRRSSDGQPPSNPANVVNVSPAQGSLGFVGRAFTWANSTALVVIVVAFFNFHNESKDNTAYLREWIARQESRMDRNGERDQARHDAQNVRIEALSAEVRSLTNAVTSLASEVRASRQKAEADGQGKPIVKRAAAEPASGPPVELKAVFREVAPMPSPGG